MYLTIAQLIFLTVISGISSSDYRPDAYNDTLESGIRSKRSPPIELPEILEAMIIDERGQFIHLKWQKERQTLANEFLPIWTAHRNEWGTYHKSRTDLVKRIVPFITYYDLEQNSAVVYNTERNDLSGSIDTSYMVEKLPVKLLHQCHRVGSKYVHINDGQSHGAVHRHKPARTDVQRFENCIQFPPSSATKKRVTKREMHSKEHNVTRVRVRRNNNQEHFYIETLLLVKYDFTVSFKLIHQTDYLYGILHYHLYQFAMIDMLFAQLRKYGLNIHINIAAIIIEDDAGAFDFVTNLPSHSTHGANFNEMMAVKFSRYLSYHDLPFRRDSIDLIYTSVVDPLFLGSLYPESLSQPVGLTWPMYEMYKTRQMYKDTNIVSLVVVLNTNIYQSACSGAHEIGHALHLAHDHQKFGPGSRRRNCGGLMQSHNPHCFHCMRWSGFSIRQLKKFTKNNRDRCLFLNFPWSLNPAGPRRALSSHEQCHCYGYQSHGEGSDQDLLQVPANSCARPLQCKNPNEKLKPNEPTIPPLDGTPCGVDKVCWQGNCVVV